MHIVYILLSQKDSQRYYIGLTDDLPRRLIEHNSACSGYSKRYAPWRIETYIAFENRNLAKKFEEYLKAGSGHAFLKRHFICNSQVLKHT